MGFARSICGDEEIRTLTKSIQKELFAVGSAMATPPESRKKPPEISDTWIDALTDRKSTRLNSSHSQISYAVFCLKKKKKIKNRPSYYSTSTLSYIHVTYYFA